MYLEYHNPVWQSWLDDEKSCLEKIFSTDRLVRIEHYGSTAIPHLIAKPIIGILVGFTDWRLLQRLIFCRVITKNAPCPSIHVQCSYWQKRDGKKFNLAIVQYHSQLWHDHLAVRDYLIMHPELVEAYGKLKLQALQKGYTTQELYRAYKTPFLKYVFQQTKKGQLR